MSDTFDAIIAAEWTPESENAAQLRAEQAHVDYQVARITDRVKAAGVARQVMQRRRFGL